MTGKKNAPSLSGNSSEGEEQSMKGTSSMYNATVITASGREVDPESLEMQLLVNGDNTEADRGPFSGISRADVIISTSEPEVTVAQIAVVAEAFDVSLSTLIDYARNGETLNGFITTVFAALAPVTLNHFISIKESFGFTIDETLKLYRASEALTVEGSRA